MPGIDLTDPMPQRFVRRMGATGAAICSITAVVAFLTVFGRGLAGTGLLILLGIVGAVVGVYAYRQPAIERDAIMFGHIKGSHLFVSIEPGWSVISLVGGILLLVITWVSA